METMSDRKTKICDRRAVRKHNRFVFNYRIIKYTRIKYIVCKSWETGIETVNHLYIGIDSTFISFDRRTRTIYIYIYTY